MRNQTLGEYQGSEEGVIKSLVRQNLDIVECIN